MKEGMVEALESMVESKLKNVHTMLPGEIEKYYGHTERKARVKPLIKIRTYKGTVLDIPPIDNVPVIFPSSTSFSLLFPLKKGDGCGIIFSEEGIGKWLKSSTEVEADSLAKFSLTDAICIPGLYSFRNVPSVSFSDASNNTGIKMTGTKKLELNNALYNLGELIFDLVDKIINLKTVGPPGNHTVLPAQQVTLGILKAKFQALLE